MDVTVTGLTLSNVQALFMFSTQMFKGFSTRAQGKFLDSNIFLTTASNGYIYRIKSKNANRR